MKEEKKFDMVSVTEIFTTKRVQIGIENLTTLPVHYFKFFSNTYTEPPTSKEAEIYLP